MLDQSCRRKGARVLTVLMACAMLAAPVAASPQGLFSIYPAPVKPDYRLDAASSEAIVVFQLPRGMMTSPFELMLFSVTEDGNPARIGGMRSSVVRVGSPKPGDAFALAVVRKPGRYVIRDLSVQVSWRACFNASTPMFDIKPGTVTFVGQIDPGPTLRDIGAKLPNKTTMGNQMFLWDMRALVTPAANAVVAKDDLAAFLQTRLPGVTAPIEIATSTETSFRTSRMLTQKQCQ